MLKKSISVSKKARYYQIGDPNKNISNVWIVLHAYAMLSEFFIQKFKNLDNGNTLIIAPEALNRFYIDGTYNRVGASWMTKEERESDIEENIQYLNAIIESIYSDVGHRDFNLNVLGFSQGGAILIVIIPLISVSQCITITISKDIIFKVFIIKCSVNITPTSLTLLP